MKDTEFEISRRVMDHKGKEWDSRTWTSMDKLKIVESLMAFVKHRGWSDLHGTYRWTEWTIRVREEQRE